MTAVNIQLIKQKVANIERDLVELRSFHDYTIDQIVSDYRTHKVVERILEVIINEAIDVNQHLMGLSPN